MKCLLFTLFIASCAPQAKAPKPANLTAAAIVLTDDALAVAIAAQPAGVDMMPWEARVSALEGVADATRSNADLCPHIATLQGIATDVQCTVCARAITTLTEALKCP